jgi:hypothetical protein
VNRLLSIVLYGIILLWPRIYASVPYKVDISLEGPQSTVEDIDHLEPSAPPILVREKDTSSKYIVQYCIIDDLGHLKLFCLEKVGFNGYALRVPKHFKALDTTIITEDLEFENPKKISKNMAELIYSIWANAIFEARYSRSYCRGLDGELHYFSVFIPCHNWMSASIWTPSITSPPGWLTCIASDIIEFTKANEVSEDIMMIKLKQLRDKYFRYIRKHAKN